MKDIDKMKAIIEVTAPKFSIKIGETFISANEYTIRHIQALVAERRIKHTDVLILCYDGKSEATIHWEHPRKDGMLNSEIWDEAYLGKGMELNTSFTLRTMKG